MQTRSAVNARLKQFALAHTADLVQMLVLCLPVVDDVNGFVGLVLGETIVDGVRRPPMVSIVPRAEVSTYVSRDEARKIPRGGTCVLPVFVKDRGESHAFPLPISPDLHRLLGGRAASGARAG